MRNDIGVPYALQAKLRLCRYNVMGLGFAACLIWRVRAGTRRNRCPLGPLPAPTQLINWRSQMENLSSQPSTSGRSITASVYLLLLLSESLSVELLYTRCFIQR